MHEVRVSIELSKSHITHDDDHNGPGNEIKVTLREGVMKLINLQKDKKFLWLMPQTLWTGVSIAYFSGNLVEML